MDDQAYRKRLTSSGELAKLRATLLQPVLRVAAIVGFPVVAFTIYDVVQMDVTWPLVLVAAGYTLILVGAWVQIRMPWRVWSLPVAMLFLGLVELILYGKAGDAQLYLMGGGAFAAFFIGARSSYGFFGGSVGLFLLFLLLQAVGRFTPLFGDVYVFSLSSWIDGLVAFGGVGGGIVGLLNTLIPYLVNALSQKDIASTMLRDDKSALRGRAAQLIQTNEELQRRTAYVERGLAIAESLSQVLELNPLLERAVGLIAEQFELDEVRIFLMDSSGEWANMRAASSETGQRFVREGYRVRRGDDSAVARILDRQVPQVFRLDEDAETFEGTELAVFVVPLRAGDRMFGILELQSADLDRFSNEERASLESVGQQLALSIANARQLGNETGALEIAGPFYRAAQQLAKVRTDRDVYAVILETLQDFDADRVMLIRLDERGEHLVVAADLQGDHLTFTSEDLELMEMQSVVDIVILGLALETSLWVEDIEASERTFSPELTEALFNLADEMGVVALAFVPLQIEAELLGGIVAFHDQPHTFSPLEQRLFAFMGELGGAALERSALVREAEARLQRERTLSRVGRRLRASFDPDTVVRTAIEEVGSVLDVGLSRIEYIEEVESSPQDDLVQAEAVPSDLRIPLGDEVDPVAWLRVRVCNGRSLGPNDLDLAEAIGVEAGRALESARLFTQTQATLQEADVLYQGGRAMIEAGRTDELLKVFVDSLVSRELDRCLLVMVERGRDGDGGVGLPSTLRVEAVWNAESDEIRYQPGERWNVRDVPVFRIPAGEALPKDEVIVISDLLHDETLDPRSRRTLTESQGVRALLASPIVSGQRVLGWFVVQSLDTPYDFTEHEVRLYRGLSDQAATLLRNFELLEMATERAERERLLAEISARMRETLDMDLIIQTALREIGENLDIADIEVQMRSQEDL